MAKQALAWCVVCGKLARWLDSNRTECASKHIVTIWGIEGDGLVPGLCRDPASATPAADDAVDEPPGQSWRDREPLF